MALFPTRLALAALDPQEYEALRSLGRACFHLRTEVELAGAAHSRICRMSEEAQDSEPDPAFTPLTTMLGQLMNPAYDQTRCAGDLSFAYTAAHTVLGIAVLDRLTTGRPPLDQAQLVELSAEPTLGTLRRALQVPVDRLLQWPAHGMSIKDAVDGRRAVLEELARIERDLRDPHALGPDVPEHRMDAAKVTTDSSPDVDPLWEAVIPLLDLVAEQTPFEIAHYLAHHPAERAGATA